MDSVSFQQQVNYFTDKLGSAQVKEDECTKWGIGTKNISLSDRKKAFIYLNTLSRYNPSGPNSIDEGQAEFILTQLGKLLK